jgi:hypothetical protein
LSRDEFDSLQIHEWYPCGLVDERAEALTLLADRDSGNEV